MEPEVFALITNDRHRIDIRIILLIRMLNDPYASPKSELPSACAALADVAISTPSARSLILVTIHIPVVK